MQDDGEGHEADDGAAAVAERHHWSGVSVWGHAEQGHDIVVGMNVKGARGGLSVQGHDIVVEKNVRGTGVMY